MQGFGNVGSVVCQELAQRGVKIIAVGDRYGAIAQSAGHRHRRPSTSTSAAGKLLKDFPAAEPIDPRRPADDCPARSWCRRPWSASSPERTPAKLQCRILAEGANGPTTPDADAILADSDIFIIPDVLCNAGGVTVSYFEWVQDIQQFFWSEEQVNQKLEELMLKAFHQVRATGPANASSPCARRP